MKEGSFDETARRYDSIAEQYREAKKLPFYDYVFRHTLFRLAGALEGKAALDLGCGEGYYTRLLKQLGAANVLGIDISREMINLAEGAERAGPLGCRYQVADVASLHLDETFDLVTAVFLLNYAADRKQLLELCRAIERTLKPGGQFIGLNFNMALDPAHYDDCRKYGRWQSTTADRVEGDVITVHLINEDATEACFDIYYLSPATYESAFAAAGLREFSWQALSVSQAGLEAYPEGYWDAFLAAPPAIGLQAKNSSAI